MKKLRIGILGCANIAEKHIVPALTELKMKYEIIGIASRNLDKARLFASKFNIKPYAGYDSLIDKEKIDVIYIPLPNSLHYEWIMKAMDQGIHVLAEKPLTTSYKETKEIIQKAQQQKLAVVENFQFRFHSQLKTIVEIIDNDVIGEIKCIRSSFGFPPFSNQDNIRYKKELGGGALLDAGAYPVKISSMFLGEDISVKASKLAYNPELQVDISGGAFLSSKNSNLFSEIAFGFDNYYQCNLELWGSKGKLTAERIFTSPPNYNPSIIIEDKHGKEKKVLPEDNHFVNMLNHVYELIEVGNFENEYKQNLIQSRLLEKMRETAENE